MTDVGVYVIGKIERCRADGQIFNLAFGRENENLLLKDIALDRLDKLGIAGAGAQVALPVGQLAQPGDQFPGRGFGRVTGVFVMPVHRHAVFRHLVHGEGANLDLDQLVIKAENGGVQGLVAVGLGIGDEILEASIFGLPQAMHMPQREIAIGRRVNQDAESDQVMNLAKIRRLLEVFQPVYVACVVAQLSYVRCH